MRIAYNEATCKQRSSLRGDLALCRRYGIDQIELRFDMIDRYLECGSPEGLKALVEKSGVTPITLNAIFDINFLNEEKRASIEQQMRRACEIGILLGVDCVIALPTACGEGDAHGWDEIREDSVRNLRWMAELGAATGMRVAFEPIGAQERCVRSIRQAWEIVRDVGSETVGLALDAYNLYLFDALKDLADLKQVDPKKVFIVHVDDADAAKPRDELGTFDRILPGDGCIDLRAFVAAFERIGYTGPYSIEILNQEYWLRDPARLFEEAYVKTRRLIRPFERK